MAIISITKEEAVEVFLQRSLETFQDNAQMVEPQGPGPLSAQALGPECGSSPATEVGGCSTETGEVDVTQIGGSLRKGGRLAATALSYSAGFLAYARDCEANIQRIVLGSMAPLPVFRE